MDILICMAMVIVTIGKSGLNFMSVILGRGARFVNEENSLINQDRDGNTVFRNVIQLQDGCKL